MNKYLKYNILVIYSIFISITSAQEFQFERKINPFPVMDAIGDTIEFPFVGGYNTPVIQFLDINGDSNPDLFIQDRANQLTYFENSGAGYDWQTDYYENLKIGSWFKFADIDDDSDFDLFTEDLSTYIRYYVNVGSPNNPSFVLGADTLKDINGIPISLNGFTIPELCDIDNDNELELFYGLQDGHIAYYEFTGIDQNNIPIFTFVSDTFESIQIVTGGGKIQSNLKHGANSMTFADIDNDNDSDLFWGDFFASSIIFIENSGDSINPYLNQDDIVQSFPTTNPLQSGGFNVPRFIDIDADQDLDMFVGIIGGSVSTLLNREENFYFYENIGTPNQNNFLLQSRQFIDCIDLGQSTIPTLVDIDNDNDLDLFIANQEDLDTPNLDNSRIYFYENTGNDFSPSFLLADSNYLNYDKRFDTNYSPVFADIDNDNDYDMFLGKWDGRLTYYQNDGSVGTPNFIRISEFYANIDVGNNSAPFFTDIDNDNDLDLFIGEFSGNINFYENIGNSTNPNFILDTINYFGIDAGEYSYPFFVDIDFDNDYDLFIGSDTSGTCFFRNTGNVNSANFIADNSFQIPLSLKSSPNLIDIDEDGDYDLFSGTAGGGLIFYKNQLINYIDQEFVNLTIQSFKLYQNFPNPFNPETTIKYQLFSSGFVDLSIYNVLGEKVKNLFSGEQKKGDYSFIWNSSNFSSGIYFYRISIDNKNTQVKKMAYLK